MSGIPPELLERILIGMMAVAKSMTLYALDHPSVQTPLKKNLAEIGEQLRLQGKLTLGIVDEVLVFEGVPFYSHNVAIKDLQSRFERMGISALELLFGLDLREYSAFLQLVNEDPEAIKTAAFSKLLADRGITHVVSKDAREVYQKAVEAVGEVLSQARMGRIPHAENAKRAVNNLKSLVLSDQPTILALTRIKSYDNYLFNHSVNVSVLSLCLAKALKVPEDDLGKVGLAGLLHDIGKTSTPKTIILKPGTLNEDEWKIMQQHPIKGEEIVLAMSGVGELVARMVREHHIAHNHEGYPGLEPGQRVHPYSKIITIADCYDAITTLRPYQKPFHPRDAMRVMERLSGKVIDPKYFDEFVKILGIYPVGSLVRLDTNEIAVVLETYAEAPLCPKIKVIFNPDGKPLAPPLELDLSRPETAPGETRAIVSTVDPILFNVDPHAYY